MYDIFLQMYTNKYNDFQDLTTWADDGFIDVQMHVSDLYIFNIFRHIFSVDLVYMLPVYLDPISG